MPISVSQTASSESRAADYADALAAVRRGKNILFVILSIVMIAELTIFFVARYSTVLDVAATGPGEFKREALQYVTGLSAFLGLTLPVVFAVMIWLTLQTLLAGRLLGTGPVAAGLCWAVVLVPMLFPWQSFLNNPAINGNAGDVASGLRIPGVLFTWAELNNPQMGPKFSTTPAPGSTSAQATSAAVLHWARYAAFPLAAILVLVLAQLKVERGLKQAIRPTTDEEAIVSVPQL